MPASECFVVKMTAMGCRYLQRARNRVQCCVLGPATQQGLSYSQQNNAVPGQPPAPPQSTKRFASAGCDNLVKIWDTETIRRVGWKRKTLEGHTDWVRDVAWHRILGFRGAILLQPLRFVMTTFVFFCFDLDIYGIWQQDKSVIIWTKDNPNTHGSRRHLTLLSIAAPTSNTASRPESFRMLFGVCHGALPAIFWLSVVVTEGDIVEGKSAGRLECVSDMAS